MSRTLTTINKAHPHNKLKAFLQRMKEQYRQHSTEMLFSFCEARLAELPDKERQECGGFTDLPRHKMLEWLLKWDEARFKEEWKTRNGWDFDECYDQAKLEARIMEHNLMLEQQKLETEKAHIRERITELERITDRSIEEDATLKEMRTLLEKLEAPCIPEHLKESYPDGMDANDLILGSWEPNVVGTYEKAWAQVRLKDGSYRLEWTWPNANSFGPTAEENVVEVRYARWREIPAGGVDLPPSEKIPAIVATGYAGVLPGGTIVDRRIHPDATPIAKNSMLGVPKPRKIDEPTSN